MFNSALVYELAVLKVYAEPLLFGIERDCPEYLEAKRLLKLCLLYTSIAADTGHINCHEAASIENTGHKILALPNTDGKISAAQIEACAAEYYDNAKPEYLTCLLYTSRCV